MAAMNGIFHHNVSGRDGSPSRPPASRAAFTLIEMMVVVALIGILIGGVFRLIGTAGENAKRGETIDRLQRLENALSGYYAEYGTYPPVRSHGSPDPFNESPEDTQDPYYKRYMTTPDLKREYWAVRASHRQPTAFEFPTPQSLDPDFPILCGPGQTSANVNPGAFESDKDDWDNVKLFRYGVLSFLVPRLLVLGIVPDENGNFTESEKTPKFVLFDKDIWNKHNLGRYKGRSLDTPTCLKQSQRETVVCGKLLPNLEHIVYGGKRDLLGVNTVDSDREYPRFSPYPYDGVRLARMTLYDRWAKSDETRNNELYYYSASPYQSYRVWSAGPNGKTFPPWIPMESLSVEDRKRVNAWISDDIVRFDR